MVLQFVKSLRNADFKLYIATLAQMMPWLFALNQTLYARWLPVHIKKMIELQHIHLDIYEEFMERKFVCAEVCK